MNQSTTMSTTEMTALEYLTFTLGSENYGLDILKVQEIRSYEAVTPIPGSPPFMKGVTNLRGIIVPIVDLRIKFNLGEVTYNQFTVVIVINVSNKVIGLVVDSVSDVILLTADDIKPAPAFGSAFNTDYLKGLGTINGNMVLLVEIEKLLSSGELGILGSYAG